VYGSQNSVKTLLAAKYNPTETLSDVLRIKAGPFIAYFLLLIVKNQVIN